MYKSVGYLQNYPRTDKKLQQKLNDSVVCAIVQSGKEQHLQISAQELRMSINGSLKGDCYLRISPLQGQDLRLFFQD
jgi:hypothetical protein